ncbi:MAG: hypothetical protein OEV94_01750 [Deltaproteobacteria bacterium]|nr:hypothetical protein [Deltaproteobacteria bacterium]
MKQRLASLMVFGALLFGAGSAKADMLFSVGLDVPVAYSFNASNLSGVAVNSTNPSGFILSVSPPFMGSFGLAMEQYSVKANTSLGSNTFDFAMYDLYYNVLSTGLHLDVGLGMGSINTASGATVPLTSSVSASQLYLTAGFALMPMLDAHVGYHIVSASKGTAMGGAANGVDLSGKLVTVGVKFSF